MQQAGRGAFVCILIAAMVASSGIARAATIIVNDASDALHATGCAATGTGTCTLRDAITFSNQNAGRDTIVPVGGLGAIAPAVPLPPLVDAVELRGTPPSASPASAWGLRLVGSGAGAGAQGLLVQASDSIVDGILIEGFGGSGIKVTGNRNTIGAPSGIYLPSLIVGAGNGLINNGGHGIEVVGGSDNFIYNNTASGNGGAGIYLGDGAARNLIGDHYRYDAGQGYTHYYYNSISQNARAGIQIGGDAADVLTTGNVARFNFFQANGGLHIDLAGDGSTGNDPGDLDTGPNGLQNAPSIAIAWDGTKHRIDGTLQSTANTGFQAHAHSSIRGDRVPVGIAQGQTDAAGNGSFSFDLNPDHECATVAVTVSTSSGSSELSTPVVAASPQPPPPVAPVFHTMAPCRLIDTRNPSSPLGGPVLASAVPRTFDLNESCSVPATAKVLSVNVTVAESTGSGFVNFGVGKCPAPLTSTINFAQGQTRANSALLNLDASGNATVTPLVTGSGTVHLILDVNGYFE